jgi:CheY-like chemotaxis protein
MPTISPTGPHILIVDDVAATRVLLKDMLDEAGFSSVLEASDGVEALEALDVYGADLIICDLFMDRMNGGELLKQLKRRADARDIPFIIVSACSDEALIKDAKKLGATDFMTKPLSFGPFQQKVKDILQTRRVCSA